MTSRSRSTDLVTLGRPHAGRRFVNPAIQRASTVLFPDVAELTAAEDPYSHYRYGRQGTPTHRAFEEAVCQLEGGHRCFSTPSGLAAITLVLTACTQAGSHILVTDNVYWPTRDFCTTVLSRFGVETEFFDPGIGAGIADLIRPNTTLLFLESPGSLTFEMTDIDLLSGIAKQHRVPVAVDNTWATPLFFQPLAYGADFSIHSASKYILGHADGLLGCVTVTAEFEPRLRKVAYVSGISTAPEDVYLGLRGLRTLGARLAQHQATALRLANWLAIRPEVDRVLYPALPDDPGYDIWQRDFSGASGLFAVVLKPAYRDRMNAVVEALHLFGLGFSWGGFESLVVPEFGAHGRTRIAWPGPGPVIRFHAGLEDAGDLLADLEQAFRAFG